MKKKKLIVPFILLFWVFTVSFSFIAYAAVEEVLSDEILVSEIETEDSENVSANSWTISNISISHRNISFKLSGVTYAQDATIQIYSRIEETEAIEIPFTISNSVEKFNLTLPDNKFLLADTLYYVTVYDSNKNSMIEYKNPLYFYSCIMNWKAMAYQNKIVIENRTSDFIKITVNAGFSEYTAQGDDEIIVISYPELKLESIVLVTCEDAYGCKSPTRELVVKSNILEKPVAIPKTHICPNGIYVKEFHEEAYCCGKLYAQIGDVIYECPYYLEGEYNPKDSSSHEPGAGECLISYPTQPINTEVTVWSEFYDGTQTPKRTYYVYDKIWNINISKISIEKIIGSVRSKSYDSYEEIISSVEMEVGNKKYRGDTRDDLNEFIISDYNVKVGDTVKIIIKDDYGYTYEKICTIPNKPPKITVNSLDSGSSVISGKTEGYSKVEIAIGKKLYKTTAKSDGTFSKKIPQQKSGTIIKVNVETYNGCYANKLIKVKVASGNVRLYNVYRNNTKLTCKISKANKGDIIKVTVGSHIYTKKISSDKQIQTITIGIKAVPAGTKIKLYYCDKFGTTKKNVSSIVYYSSSIYVGMSANNVGLTPWGKPIRKNNYGYGYFQWVFEKDYQTIYVYIQNGYVYNIQKLNY